MPSISHHRPGILRRLVATLGPIVALTLVLGLYAWTAATSAESFPTELSLNGRDYYNHLTDAFLHGQVALRVEPPAGLVALNDPYDPRQYSAFAPPYDMSLFEGRYYVYWGPTPALTLFLPARLLLLGNDLSERAAIVIFSFVGLLLALALLRFALRRFLPGTPRWMLYFGGLALATGTTALYNLRRPTIYELALSAGFCFTMAAAYLLLRGVSEERHRLRRLTGGSACLGLAAGARPTLALTGLLALAALMFLVRSGTVPSKRARRRVALALLGPVTLAGLLLLAYNAARFGSPAQFGLKYQLNEFEPFAPDGGFPQFIPGIYLYLLAPPHVDLNFPFVHLPPPPEYPGTLPPGYNREHIAGMLPMVPIVLLVLAAIPIAVRSVVPRVRALGVVIAAGSLMGGLLMLAICASIYAGTMRYGVDFVPLILVAALLAWILLARSPRKGIGRVVGLGGAVLIAWTAVAGTATSVTGEFDSLQFGRPGTYASLERALSVLPTAAVALRGRPIITQVIAPAGADVRVGYRQVSAGRIVSMEVRAAPAVLEVVSPDRRTVRLRATASGAPDPSFAPPRLVVRSGERGPEAVVSYPNGPIDVPVVLKRGLNRVGLRVDERPTVGPSFGQDLKLSEVFLTNG